MNRRIKEFIVTAAYAGYCPIAPGTAGTLVGMALYFLGHLVFGELSWVVNAAAIPILFYPFMRWAGDGEAIFAREDPPQVVIDEMLGYWVALFLHPFSAPLAIAAFFIFRLLDIVKPWPARRLERLGGGLGIMIDDCVAGAYTNLILIAGALLLKMVNVTIY